MCFIFVYLLSMCFTLFYLYHTVCVFILQDNHTHRYPLRRENVTWLKTPQELDSTPRTPSSNVSTNHLKNILYFI